MNPYISKAVEITKWLVTRLIEIGRWTYARMQAVEIDQPRGATLCVGFQLIVLLALMISLPPGTASVETRPDRIQEPIATEVTSPQDSVDTPPEPLLP